jgi:pimeloyl-ACP methyl ester carboxylesterase
MTRSILMPPAVFALLALTAIGAQANLPSVANSATPASIRLVGALGGVPDAVAGQFKIVVNDIGDRPINECLIVIDLSNCADLTICSDQSDPNALTNCAAKTVRKFTNALGEVTFTLLGGSTGAGHASSLANSARIFGNGELLGTPSVSSFDLDGAGGVGAGDLSVWLADFGSGVNWARSDFDGSGTVGAGDLSEWLAVFGSGASTQSCTSSCP